VEGKKFVDDIEKFKRGVPIEPMILVVPDKAEKSEQTHDLPIESTAVTENSVRTKDNIEKPPEKPRQASTNKLASETQKRQGFKHSHSPPVVEQSKLPLESRKNALKTQSKVKSGGNEGPRSKGTAAFECGCFGNYHKPISNCLSCGRISCEREGYDFCPFCGYLVEPQKKPDDDDPLYPAWILKETVLKHQRESAKRTLIFDDQADHHGAQNSEWLTKNEQEDVEIEQAARFERLHQRKNVELKFT
jgi:uncharacterized Zn finger protein (UPF0148 family)